MPTLKVCMECGDAFDGSLSSCPYCGLDYGKDIPPMPTPPPAKPTEGQKSRRGRQPKVSATPTLTVSMLQCRADVTFPFDIWKNSYITILAPGIGPMDKRPFCPAEPKKLADGTYSTEEEDVLNWVEATAMGGQARKRNYTISAILYFVDCFWELHDKNDKVNPDRIKVVKIIREYFLGGSY